MRHTSSLQSSLTVALSAVLILVSPGLARSQWDLCGVVLCDTTITQIVDSCVPDGSGGVLINCHQPNVTVPSLLCYRVTMDGYLPPDWPECGLALTTHPVYFAFYGYGKSIPDGAGGALIGWHDHSQENGLGFLQRVTANSICPGWPADGVRISTDHRQDNIELATDGSEGAFVTWNTGQPRAYAQHITGGGGVAAGWPAVGKSLYALTSIGSFTPCAVADGNHGAIFAAVDHRNYSVTQRDIYAQHLSAEGSVVPDWTENGNPVCTAPGNQGWNVVRAVTDGSGGAIVVWDDDRDLSTTSFDLYAQRISSSGSLDWTESGVPLTRAPNSQGLNSNVVAIADGLGGAFVAWSDRTSRDVYLQHVDASGAIPFGWPADGLAIATTTGDESNPALALDDAGGVFIAWLIWNNRVCVQRITATGSVAPDWPSAGWTMCPVSALGAPYLAEDGNGGVIIGWTRGGGGSIPVVHHLRGNGYPVAVPDLPAQANGQTVGLSVIPNPSRGVVDLALGLPDRMPLTAHVLDASGRLIRELATSGSTGSTRRTLTWDGRDFGGRDLPPGVYFIRVAAGSSVVRGTIVRIR